jgi:AraC-like DNA-binding protein
MAELQDAGESSSKLKTQFASNVLAAELNDRARLRLFQELNEQAYGDNLTFAADRPLFVRLRCARFGPVLVEEFARTLIRTARTARNVRPHGDDNFFFGLRCGTRELTHGQRGWEVVHEPGSFIMLSNADPDEVQLGPSNLFFSLYVPRARLIQHLDRGEDLIARRIDRDQPAVRFLRKYIKLALEPDSTNDDPALTEHVGNTLIVLTALCLGAARDAVEPARAHGVRAARLQAIKAEIKAGFSQPNFSERQVAAKLGLTSRYVQDVLHETGATFTDWVLKLRLQKARGMLANPRNDHLRIIEIAYACGFNEVSYFNRCFRRWFGSTPTACRM